MVEGELGELLAEARELLPDAVALRRRIHERPELGLALPETRAAVLEAIADLGLDVRESVETSGIVATLEGGRPGPTLLLRADMDALPMPEDTGLPYASQVDGRMHACGHDAHTAMLAGAARMLAARRESLPGVVRFLFQPGEEGHFGAKVMLEEGLFEGEGAVDAAFAIHVDPRVPVGRVASRPGPLLASADVWGIELTGRGGHASMPHDTLDPVPVACEIVLALQSLVTRRIDAFDPVVLSATKIETGTTNNVIPERATITGTLRSTSERARKRAQEGLRRVAQGVAAAHEVEARVRIEAGYPVTVNDAGFARFTERVTAELLGDHAFIEMPAPVMGAEDFSYFLARVPGALVFLGVRPPGEGRPAPCHSNRMQIHEEGMVAGIALHTAIALRWLHT